MTNDNFEMIFRIYDEDGYFYYEVGPDSDQLNCFEIRYFERKDADSPYERKPLQDVLLLSPDQTKKLSIALTYVVDFHKQSE